MTTSTGLATPWLPLRGQTTVDGLPLYCLPHAGGGASAFRTWLTAVPGVAVVPVQPPGREARFRDPVHEHMGPLVEELASVVIADAGSRPYAVYGHSLGALVAFELVREIRRRGADEPVHLFVSGSVAPHVSGHHYDGPPVLGMTRPQLVHMLRTLGGTPDWLLNDPSVLEMILPAVLADFSVKETYPYTPEAPLLVPLTVIGSTDDPRAPVGLQARWQDHTFGEFTQHTLVGGHFAVFEQAELTHKYLVDGLRL